MCATPWCNLEFTSDLAYLMVFMCLRGYLILFISLTSLIFFYLNLVVAPLGVFWCRLSTVKVILEVINWFFFAISHCNRWYCIK